MSYARNAGGTVGLFCGMSILSLIELVFWIVSFVINRGSDLMIVKNSRRRRVKSAKANNSPVGKQPVISKQ